MTSAVQLPKPVVVVSSEALDFFQIAVPLITFTVEKAVEEVLPPMHPFMA